jgi:hypothetical protein
MADTSLRADAGAISMREKWLAVRDTLIVLSMQLVFRAFLLMRRLNY